MPETDSPSNTPRPCLIQGLAEEFEEDSKSRLRKLTDRYVPICAMGQPHNPKESCSLNSPPRQSMRSMRCPEDSCYSEVRRACHTRTPRMQTAIPLSQTAILICTIPNPPQVTIVSSRVHRRAHTSRQSIPFSKSACLSNS